MSITANEIQGLMRGVASALQPTLAGIERRSTSTDELLADIEARVATLEAQYRAMLEPRDGQTDDD